MKSLLSESTIIVPDVLAAEDYTFGGYGDGVDRQFLS